MKETVKEILWDNALILFLIAAVVIFSIFNPGYLTSSNVIVILKQASLLALLGMAQTVVMLTGCIDLSVGSTIALATVLFAGMIKNSAIPSFVPVICMTLAGAALGGITGTVITKLNIPPFITTFAANYAYRGVAWLIMGSYVVYNLPVSYRRIGMNEVFGVPITIWFEILIGIGLFLLLKKTVLGRKIYFTGSNRKAAEHSGIHTNRIIIIAYVIGSALAAFTGVLYSARLNAAEAGIGGTFALDSIAVCLIGGCAITGGKGSVWGTAIGAIVISTIKNGMNYIQVSSELQSLVLGLLIVAAVFFNQFASARGKGR